MPTSPLPRWRVLAIDDEPLMGSFIARSLRTSAVVDVTTSIAEALHAMVAHRYDAIVCDVNMADGGALALHHNLTARSPQLLPSLIYTTGGATSVEQERFLVTVQAQLLAKPFRPSQLCDAVRARVSLLADEPRRAPRARTLTPAW